MPGPHARRLGGRRRPVRIEALQPFGIDEAAAVSYSVLSHLVNVVPVSLVGAALLVGQLLFRRQPQPQPATE